MSKLNKDILTAAIDDLFAFSNGETITYDGEQVKGKKRNFTETIDLQIALKNYDPTRDKRFTSSIKLPKPVRPNMKICILGNAVHAEQAESAEAPFMTVDDLKKFNKNKKIIKKWAKKFDAFVASDTLIKQIPRLLGPALTKAGKFPTLCPSSENAVEKAEEIKTIVKFQMKKVTCLNVSVGNLEMTKDEVRYNVQLCCNFLASLLKKNWQNIGKVYLHSTMGPSQQIFF
uniref:Ribosomal protein n=1 Tax=Phaeomonas parva TaxID=124430 RepID=A0A7S1U654_9STRA|mmetsp:Transcript_33483/g.105788  ORF Transcript_33483/g.105788 Transcript_33483/m.105788 type:complete len:230 (+) Transcript_33483:207-896(+)|eukprot:CAMPEP_0118882996 /NCGR_PEP_ID=MMETSP1163-20130328/22154_1 /TAXON_ID=124430 /ORGANISM="Phaeomonas parva, Strain CCMP2877" /LENGTH=229 /DNA_ID=CAMNT_0006820269 /DNA_START=89 /DNA_END=778 /DNA_ORIENTATION=+